MEKHRRDPARDKPHIQNFLRFANQFKPNIQCANIQYKPTNCPNSEPDRAYFHSLSSRLDFLPCRVAEQDGFAFCDQTLKRRDHAVRGIKQIYGQS